jgi:hypothetical protein
MFHSILIAEGYNFSSFDSPSDGDLWAIIAQRHRVLTIPKPLSEIQIA